MKRIIIYVAACLLSYSLQGQQPDFIKGIYGNPGALLSAGHSFQSLGVNAVFVRSISLNEKFFSDAKKEGVRVYVEFPTLNGKQYLETHPEAWPINEKGEKSPPADWFIGICPTDPGFLDYRVQQLRSLLKEYPVDGVWLDYLHLHAQFETPQPILPETCFCERCVNQFQQASGVPVTGGTISQRAQWILSQADSSWRVWRSGVVNGWVTEMRMTVKELRPEALLGIYYCPWYPEDFNNAQFRILGLDLQALSALADVFTPMLFHHMMGRPVDWVAEYTEWLVKMNYTDGKNPMIWPIVQAHNHPGIITAEEFRQVMMNGSRPPSTGIMMFSEQSLLQDKRKLEVVRELYR